MTDTPLDLDALERRAETPNPQYSPSDECMFRRPDVLGLIAAARELAVVKAERDEARSVRDSYRSQWQRNADAHVQYVREAERQRDALREALEGAETALVVNACHCTTACRHDPYVPICREGKARDALAAIRKALT